MSVLPLGPIPPIPPSVQGEARRRILIIIGIAVVLVIVAVIWLFSRPAAEQRQAGIAPTPPEAAAIQLSDVKLATAQNFVGATVTYVEGKVANTGSKTLTHAVVEVTFRNSLNEVVQREDVPLMVLEDRPGYSDAVDLSASPLATGQSRPFRLTFEHVSADWAQSMPELKIVSVTTK
jgi:ABC-type Na+ efflux pump permease subunit